MEKNKNSQPQTKFTGSYKKRECIILRGSDFHFYPYESPELKKGSKK